MTESTFADEVERFITRLDEIRADDFAGSSTADELALLLRTSTEMDDLLDALNILTSKKLWSIPADDLLDTQMLLTALAENPALHGKIIDALLDLRTQIPALLGLLSRNRKLSELQAMRIAVVGDEGIRMTLAANRSLPNSVYEVLAANGSDETLCILMGNPSFPPLALSLIPTAKQERYQRTVARCLEEVQSATTPSAILGVYSPGMDERMDLLAVDNPNLPASAVATLRTQGSRAVLKHLEKNVKAGFYRYYAA